MPSSSPNLKICVNLPAGQLSNTCLAMSVAESLGEKVKSSVFPAHQDEAEVHLGPRGGRERIINQPQQNQHHRGQHAPQKKNLYSNSASVLSH